LVDYYSWKFRIFWGWLFWKLDFPLWGLVFFCQLTRGRFVQFKESDEPDDSDKLGCFGTDLGSSWGSGHFSDTSGGLDGSITSWDELINPDKIQEHGKGGDEIEPEVKLQKVIFLQ
jgi:hypothetical protein